MNKNDISIATITWARNDQEEDLLRRSLEELARLDMTVYVTDGGSNEKFLGFVESLPHFKLLEAKTSGLWAQARNSLMGAFESGSPFILYTEPDKLDFFKSWMTPMLSQTDVDGQTGIVTASRSEKGFASFPAFQQMSETTINRCCAELTGHPLDFTYGPFLMNSRLVPYLALQEEEIGWGWRLFAFGVAHRLGYQLKEYVADFYCPEDQQKDNQQERLYRMHQLSQSIKGIVLSATVPLH